RQRTVETTPDLHRIVRFTVASPTPFPSASPVSLPPNNRPHAHPSISHKAAYWTLAVGVLGVGWSAIFVRLSGVSGSTSAFYRMAIAQLVFVPWWLVVRRSTPRPTRNAVVAA